MRVLFFGNHTVGVRALVALCDSTDVVGVIAHPADDEDGCVYESVFDRARDLGIPAERLTPRSPEFLPFVQSCAPDLLWVTDYRYLLSPEVLKPAALGAINLHPSLLPRYRGRAPLNWAILNGERLLGLTAHFIEEGVDNGDIIAQQSFELHEDQDAGDALRLLYPMYTQMTRRVIQDLHAGDIRRQPQDHTQATVFPARKPSDGEIDWRQPADRVRNLVRAVARPYPGACTYRDGQKWLVWSARPHRDSRQEEPGTVVDVVDGDPIVATADGRLRITELTSADDQAPLTHWHIGDRLGAS